MVPQTAAPRRWLWLTIAALGVAAGVAAVAAWRHYHAGPPLAGSTPEEEDDLAVARPGYLGPQACAECHAARVDEFLKSRHAQACVEPTESTVTPSFASGRGAHTTPDHSVRFELSRSGDGFFMNVLRPGPGGDQRSAARVAFVYGSRGAADEMYFTWHGDQLAEMPMAWLYPEQTWGNTTLDPHGSGDLTRETGPRCLECHNTWFAHVPGTPNRYHREGYILGATCERCHGPGADHVAYHREHADARTGRAIVQPKNLERERRIEVCTQCHSNAIKRKTAAFSYRPGEPLEKYYGTIETRYPEQDHVANQNQYLRRSKCFQKSEMTCTTCHNPHRATDLVAVQRACLQCHELSHCKERPRLPAGVRDNCSGCHMPARVWMNVHFHTDKDLYVPPIRRHDHQIAVNRLATREVLLEWYNRQPDEKSKAEAARLKTALVDYWLAEAEQRRRDYRFLAVIGALREAARLDPTPSLQAKLRDAEAVQARINSTMAEGAYLTARRQFTEAIAQFKEALAIKPDLALGHCKLGTAYRLTGRDDLAIEQFELAAKYDPNDPESFFMLGGMAYVKDSAAEAVAYYRRADAAQPYSAEIKYRLGLALMKQGQPAEAVGQFRAAVAIDPRHAGGYQGLAAALRSAGQADEAVGAARRAAHLTRQQNADVLLTLADCLADSGQWPEAEETAARAVTEAMKSDTRLVPQARRRLDEIRRKMKAPK